MSIFVAYLMLLLLFQLRNYSLSVFLFVFCLFYKRKLILFPIVSFLWANYISNFLTSPEVKITSVLIATLMTSPSRWSISNSNLITPFEESNLNVPYNSLSLLVFPVAEATQVFTQSLLGSSLSILFLLSSWNSNLIPQVLTSNTSQVVHTTHNNVVSLSVTWTL